MSLPVPAPDSSFPALRKAQEGDDDHDNNFYIQLEELHQSKNLKEPFTLQITENPQSMTHEKEKQISIDPFSLKEETKIPIMYPPLPLPPTNPKFISCSLPNSTTSSPLSASSQMRSLNKWKSNQSHVSSQSDYLTRSKSCGEGRVHAPPDDFDIWSRKSKEGFKFEADINISDEESKDPYEDQGFKCGALCLFLPGFGKGKPVRRRRKEGEEEDVGSVISRTVSLEKFECGSWSSSVIINDDEEEDDDNEMKLYFDLPLELIRNSVNDANSPVKTAFVFDRRDQKGVLKKNTLTEMGGRKSHESSRHVQFSTSTSMSYPASPSTCITPRLRQAREDFNAYLEAQSA